MKTQKFSRIISFAMVLFVLILASCKKENSLTGAMTDPTSIASEKAIAVGVSSVSGDSIYVVKTCARDHHLDSVSFNNLPPEIVDYLNANYAGYAFQKAYTDKDSSGNVSGYVAIFDFNGNPVGLKFDASGNFLNVLEQREGLDLKGKGWHEGGCFGDRDGRHRDTVDLSALPVNIISYFNENYSSDTLVKAYRNRDSSYVVFSIDNGVFATTFDAGGNLTARIELHPRSAFSSVSQASLPDPIQTYLNATYPNYVFKRAFSFSTGGTVSGYIVCVDANGTKYAVQFDASGNFIKFVVIR